MCDMGANVREQDANGNTIAHIAAKQGCREIYEHCIQNLRLDEHLKNKAGESSHSLWSKNPNPNPVVKLSSDEKSLKEKQDELLKEDDGEKKKKKKNKKKKGGAQQDP
jgi:ankyrin repeat protein